MQEKDSGAVHSLLQWYLNGFEIAPEFTQEECERWFLYKKDSVEKRVIWAYIIEVITSLFY